MGRKTTLKNISAFLNKTHNTPKLAKWAENNRVGLVSLFCTCSLLAFEEEKG